MKSGGWSRQVTLAMLCLLWAASQAYAITGAICISAKLNGSLKLRATGVCKTTEIQLGSFDGTTLQFSGINVQVVSGSGATHSVVNGKGNLIVGYNEGTMGQTRTGSNNLIVGDEHEYTSSGGFVAGSRNTISGGSASVSGGFGNTAGTGVYASVSGGNGNTASGKLSSVSGGQTNTASAVFASVSGGSGNTASGLLSSVSGGSLNTASGGSASVSGGELNIAGNNFASVSGGSSNNAAAQHSSISGGLGVAINFANEYGWVAGSFGATLGPNQFSSQ